MNVDQKNKYSVERILELMEQVETVTGKFFVEIDPQLECDIWEAVDQKETHKYSFLINQLGHLIDDINLK